MQARRVDEYQFPKIVLGQNPAFDQAPGFAQHGARLHHVPVANVGPEHRLELGTHRRQAPVEGNTHHAVVGLAAKVEVVAEQAAQVVDLFHAAVRKLVERFGALRPGGAVVRVGAHARTGQVSVAVLVEQIREQVDVKFGRVQVFQQRVYIALFEMLDQVVQQHHGPGHAAFQKTEVQSRKTLRHTAEKQRAAKELGAGGETAQVVEHVVAGRRAVSAAARRRVAHRRHAEFDAAAPERVVVERRVHRNRTRGFGEGGKLRRLARYLRVRAPDLGADHDRLVARREHRVVEFGQRLGRCEGRDHRHRRHAGAHLAEHVGVHGVERAAGGLAQLVVLDVQARDAVGGVAVRVVDAGVSHTRLEQPRQHGHRAVAGVFARRCAPPDAAGVELVGRAAHALARLLDHFRATHLRQKVVERELTFEYVRIGVDHRMVEPRAYIAAGKLCKAGHVSTARPFRRY